MKMPDVNILIYAHRDQHSHHKFYKKWLESLCSGPEPFALSPLVAVAFVKIVTNPSVFEYPTPLPQAFAFIEAILSSEQCRQPELGKNHWKFVRQLCESSRAAGKLVADAQHAAVAIEHACTWVTRDHDFQKFKSQGLRLEFLEP